MNAAAHAFDQDILALREAALGHRVALGQNRLHGRGPYRSLASLSTSAGGMGGT